MKDNNKMDEDKSQNKTCEFFKDICKSCGEEIEYIGPYWKHVYTTPRHPAFPKSIITDLKPRSIECADKSLLCEFIEKKQRFGLSVEFDGRVSYYWIQGNDPEFSHCGYLPDEFIRRILAMNTLGSDDFNRALSS